MEELRGKRLIECVAKENYSNFCKAVLETEESRANKQIVIFGAGILGMQFYYTMEGLGITEVIFCDNNPKKWGQQIDGSLIVSPIEIADKTERYYIFVAMENYYDCLQQIEDMGYKPQQHYYNLTNCSEKRLVEDFQKDWMAGTLILGDCTASIISVEDEEKESITDMLYQEEKVKILAMNGLYMRSYYNVFRMNLVKNPLIQKVIVLLNPEIFGEKYPLLSKNQHEKVMKKLQEITGTDVEEISEFVREAERRSKEEKMFDYASPNRESELSEIKIEQGRRVHMKLNYMYRLKENAESIYYLDRMLEECRDRKIENIYVIMPVNYEMGEKYFANQFYEKYEAICNILRHHIVQGEGQVIDLSYALRQSDFICLRSTNEGIRECGRKKIVREIAKVI